MWNNPEASPPPLGQRVIVETAEGSTLYARRHETHWLDDSGAVIHSPVAMWRELVSSTETGS